MERDTPERRMASWEDKIRCCTSRRCRSGWALLQPICRRSPHPTLFGSHIWELPHLACEYHEGLQGGAEAGWEQVPHALAHLGVHQQYILWEDICSTYKVRA